MPNYALEGAKWSDTNITYSFATSNYSNDASAPVIAHPGYVMALLGDAAARTRRRSARTGRLLALAVLTTERKAA